MSDTNDFDFDSAISQETALIQQAEVQIANERAQLANAVQHGQMDPGQAALRRQDLSDIERGLDQRRGYLQHLHAGRDERERQRTAQQVPGWDDAKVRKQEQIAITNFLVEKHGYKPDVIPKLGARDWQLARQAWKAEKEALAKGKVTEQAKRDLMSTQRPNGRNVDVNAFQPRHQRSGSREANRAERFNMDFDIPVRTGEHR